MSYKTQESHMARLAELTSQDLSYIFGEREGGPNGAKRDFLRIGKTFLRAMAKDLEFIENNVFDCAGGIGVPGDVTLMGMWDKGNGVYITIRGENDFLGRILYRHISHIKDYSGGYNLWLNCNCLQNGYHNLLSKFFELKEATADGRAA